MRLLLISLTSLLALGFSTSPAAAQGKPRNVVLLIADDLGRELGCYGNKVVRTPYLDALAKNGVHFTNGYATVASCSASRAALFTGRYIHSCGQYGHAHHPHNVHSFDNVQSLPALLRSA